MTSYTNPIPAGGVNPRKLRSEIYGAFTLSNQVMVSGPTPSPGTWMTSGDCIVDFGASSLSAGQQTTLTTVVNAHSPGSYTAFPTLAQMALEPGYFAGNTMWVPDCGVGGSQMVFDGTAWRRNTAPIEYRKSVGSDQGSISTSPVNITGLDVAVAAGFWYVDLAILYQSSIVTAPAIFDFVATSSDIFIADTIMMKAQQGSSAASSILLVAGVDDGTIDVGSALSLSVANANLLIRCRAFVRATASTTIQPRIWAAAAGTLTVKAKSSIWVKELP